MNDDFDRKVLFCHTILKIQLCTGTAFYAMKEREEKSCGYVSDIFNNACAIASDLRGD